MPAGRCLNCDTAFDAQARFCSGCGQRTDTSRLSIADLVRELMHSFLDVERGPLGFLRALLTRPGYMARDYVAGRRRRYYGPFATLAVLVGVTALAINLSGYQVLARDGLADAPTDLLRRHFNLLLLVQLPLLGAICATLFRRARLTLSEHMTLVAYALSLRAIVLAATVVLSQTASHAVPTQAEVIAYWAAWYLYFGWAASQFYGGRRMVNGVLGAIAAALGHAAIMALTTLGSAAWMWVLGIRFGQ
jgi:hypothetical protein